MKNSVIVARIHLGPVLDETVMSAEEVREIFEIMDLNNFEIEPMYHILTDIDTGGTVRIQNLGNGLIEKEDYHQ